METPESFIKRYFDERRQLKRGWLSHSQPFREKFFRNANLPVMEKGGSEHIEQIEITSDVAIIITSEIPYEAFSSNRFRYRIERKGEGWVIGATEWECFICKGSGRNRQGLCHNCSGRGWKDYGEISS